MIDYELAKKTIDLCIGCGGLKQALPYREALSEMQLQESAENINFYWVEIKKNFKFPPTRVYQFVTHQQSFLHLGFTWQFCFIFLNDKTQHGLMLLGYNMPW